jgi:hypothetical protein
MSYKKHFVARTGLGHDELADFHHKKLISDVTLTATKWYNCGHGILVVTLMSINKKNGCSPCFTVITTFVIDIQKLFNAILHSSSCEHATNTLIQ